MASKYQVGFEQLRQMVNRMGTKVGLASEPKPLKSGVQKKQTREDGMMKSQRLMLTWLVEQPSLYQGVKAYLVPEDFTEGIYAKVAGELFSQFEEADGVNPAKIVSMFADEEQQRQVAEIFNTSVDGIEKQADFEKAIKETLLRIKQNSMEQKQRNLDPTDMAGLSQMIEDKRRLQELEKLHISLK